MTADKSQIGTGKVGGATGETTMQVDGTLDQAAGTVQPMLGDAVGVGKRAVGYRVAR